MLRFIRVACLLLLDSFVISILSVLGVLLINYAIVTIDRLGILVSFFFSLGGALLLMGATEHAKSTLNRTYWRY